MKSSELKRSLLRQLDMRFGELGFVRRSDRFLGNCYRRATAGGWRLVSPAIYNRTGAIELDSASVGLRLDAVEDSVNRFEEPPPVPLRPEDLEARSTLGFRAEPKGLAAVFRKSWIIADDSAAIKAAAEFVPRVMSKAEPFWEQFSDPRAALEMLSRDDEESRSYGGPDHFRAEKAVALALLLDGKDAAGKLAEQKKLTLRGDQLLAFTSWAERALV